MYYIGDYLKLNYIDPNAIILCHVTSKDSKKIKAIYKSEENIYPGFFQVYDSIKNITC